MTRRLVVRRRGERQKGEQKAGAIHDALIVAWLVGEWIWYIIMMATTEPRLLYIITSLFFYVLKEASAANIAKVWERQTKKRNVGSKLCARMEK